jgi:hypothetical protein
MQAYSLIVDPDQTYDSLKDLGSKLKLPAGWKFRVKVLDQDLTIRAVDGIAHIVQDDLENTYDLCGGSRSHSTRIPHSPGESRTSSEMTWKEHGNGSTLVQIVPDGTSVDKARSTC